MEASQINTTKKLGHRRFKDGEVTYKAVETTKLMSSIQLGVRSSLADIANKEDMDLVRADFDRVDTVDIKKSGNLQQFKFSTFAPFCFRKFRNAFGIDEGHFLQSFCEQQMIELSNPGASGSIFYVTQDDEIIVKTVSRSEARFLQDILQEYYINLQQHNRTLLTKFFGFFCYSMNAKNVRIVVMNNLLPSQLKIHHKFDLKGSTLNRKAGKKEKKKASPTYKDLDFLEMYPEGIFLQTDLYDKLVNTIERDCRVLESLEIMDYSLLLGIHNITQDRQTNNTALGPSLRKRSGTGESRRLHYLSSPMESITADIKDEEYGAIPAMKSNGDSLQIFIGIIDLLQSFGPAKKLEHTWKSIIHDSDTVSVHNPTFYAERFKTFLFDKVFKKITS